MRAGQRGSRGLCARTWKLRRKALGDNHPATRAALGRLLWWLAGEPGRENIPQIGGPMDVAWRRESGAIPGYLNRGERKALGRGKERHAGSSPAESTYGLAEGSVEHSTGGSSPLTSTKTCGCEGGDYCTDPGCDWTDEERGHAAA